MAYCQKSSACHAATSQAGSVRSHVGGCCGQDRVPEFGVPPSAVGALGQVPLAQSLQGKRLCAAGPAPLECAVQPDD